MDNYSASRDGVLTISWKIFVEVFKFYLCECFAYMRVCVPHACIVYVGEKKALNPLELES